MNSDSGNDTPSCSARVRAVVGPLAVICGTCVVVVLACLAWNRVPSMFGAVRQESRIEAELGRRVRVEPERFAFQDTMAWQFIGPALESSARAFKEGRLPLWEPAMSGGWPVLASGSAGVLSPLKLPLYVLDGPAGESIWLLLKILASGIFAFMFCLRMCARPWAAALGGVAYAVCGYSVCYAPFEHDPVAFFPLVLWSADRVLDSAGPGRIALMALAIALVLVSGHPVLGGMILVATASWVVIRLFARRESPVAMVDPGRRILAALLIAFALSGVVVAPFVEFVANGWSYKMSSGVEVPEATVERTFPFGLRRAASTIVPHLVEAWRGADLPGGSGLFGKMKTSEGPRSVYRSFLYAYVTWVGVIPLLLAGWMFMRSPRRWHPLVPFVCLPALVVLAVPGTGFLAGVPLMSAVLPRWFASWLCLGIAALAAVGMDRLLRDPPKAARRLALGALFYSVVAIGVVVVTFVLARGTGSEWGPPPVPELAIERLMLPLCLAWLAPLAAFLLWRSPGRLAIVLVILTSLDLAIHGGWILGTPPREPSAAGEVQPLLGLPGDPAARVAAKGNSVVPNTALYYGLNDFQATIPLFVNRYHRFMEVAVPELREMYPTSVVVRDPNPTLDLASIAHYLVPSTWSFGRGFPEVVFEGSALRVIGRAEALPRAYVVTRATAVGSMDEAADLLRADPIARRSIPVVEPGEETGPWDADTGDAAAPTAPFPVRIMRYDSNEVTIDVSRAGPGLLVLTDVFYPGWSADVDDRPAQIVPVNVAFRGLVLAGDASVVTFRYRPYSVAIGLVLSLLTLAVMAVVLVMRASVHRRQSVDPSGGTR